MEFIMTQVSEIEFNSEAKCYQAIMTDGSIILLEAETLREAENEADKIARDSEFTSFFAVRSWE